jgi:hypothetical protein
VEADHRKDPPPVAGLGRWPTPAHALRTENADAGAASGRALLRARTRPDITRDRQISRGRSEMWARSAGSVSRVEPLPWTVLSKPAEAPERLAVWPARLEGLRADAEIDAHGARATSMGGCRLGTRFATETLLGGCLIESQGDVRLVPPAHVPDPLG